MSTTLPVCQHCGTAVEWDFSTKCFVHIASRVSSCPTTVEREATDISVCFDCIMLIANGDIGDHGDGYPGMTGEADGDHIYNRPTDDADENPNSRHAALMDQVWPYADGWSIVCGGDDEGFSYSACEGCGSRLGGDRFSATAIKG